MLQKTAPSIRLVCFDIGGVLLRIFRSWQEACQTLGLEYKPSLAQAENKKIFKTINTQFETGRINCDQYFEGYIKTLSSDYKEDEIRRVIDAWILGPYPKVDDLIASIKSDGIDTALLSNIGPRHWGLCQSYNCIRAIKHHLLSFKLGCMKPDPKIYQLAYQFLSQQIPNLQPQEILFVDDMEENVLAARTQLWQAHLVDHKTGAPGTAALRQWFNEQGKST